MATSFVAPAIAAADFSSPSITPTPTGNVESLELSRLNGDSFADAIVAGGNSFDQHSVLLGGGDGTFGQAVGYSTHTTTSSGARAVAAGDFDGDGDVDVAVPHQYGPAVENVSEVAILRGDGSGAFAAPFYVAQGGIQARDAAAADLNGDGRKDLLLASLYNRATPPMQDIAGQLAVLIADGSGGFAPVRTLPLPDIPNSLIVGDVDGDGNADVVTLGEATHAVTTLLGDGAGNLTVAGTFAPGAGGSARAFWLAAGDLDSDGDLDLVTQDFSGGEREEVPDTEPTTVRVILGDGHGGFVNDGSYTTGDPEGLYAVAIGDLTGDGRADVAATSLRNFEVAIFPGNGDGTLSPPISVPVGVQAHGIALADLNGDGALDIASAGGAPTNLGSVSVVLGIRPGPEEQLDSLEDAVDELVGAGILTEGQGNSLTQKLQAALARLDAGQPGPAVNELEAFIRQVQALARSGSLSSEQANSLVQAAQAAITSIEDGAG